MCLRWEKQRGVNRERQNAACSIHPSIYLSSIHFPPLIMVCGGSSLKKEAQTSLSPATLSNSSRGIPRPEPPHQAFLNVKEQRVYSELPPGNGHLYLRSCSLGHYPMLGTIGRASVGMKIDKQIKSLAFRFSSLFTTTDRCSPHRCRCRSDPPGDLPLHFPLICEQDPEVLKLVHSGQDLLPHQEQALHLFLAENHGLRFWGADCHRDRFILSCQPVQWELEVTGWCN